jgi:aspartate/methionine/tyrosine aminotransferase
MPDSRTRDRMIQRHLANELLQAPSLSSVRRSKESDLSVDQLTVQPDPAIVKAAVTALEQGQTHYVDVPGIAPLREAVAAHLRDMGLIGYDQAKVLVTAGLQECRFLSIQMIGAAFGCIALPKVVHPGARQAAGVRRLDVRFFDVDAENGMLPTPASIRQVLKAGCRLVYLESPVRLTGATFDRATVDKLASLIQEFDAAVLWDQGLAPWVQNGGYASLGTQPGMAERVAVFGEAWPGIGLESWFIGYVAADEAWVESMRSQKQVMSICTSTPSQYAALKAAEAYGDLHAAQLARLTQHRREALKVVRTLDAELLTGVVAHLIALQPVDPQKTAATLHEGGFYFADGADFGAPGVVRLSLTTDDPVARVLDLLR